MSNKIRTTLNLSSDTIPEMSIDYCIDHIDIIETGMYNAGKYKVRAISIVGDHPLEFVIGRDIYTDRLYKEWKVKDLRDKYQKEIEKIRCDCQKKLSYIDDTLCIDGTELPK